VAPRFEPILLHLDHHLILRQRYLPCLGMTSIQVYSYLASLSSRIAEILAENANLRSSLKTARDASLPVSPSSSGWRIELLSDPTFVLNPTRLHGLQEIGELGNGSGTVLGCFC
jgi:hypothetical protein